MAEQGTLKAFHGDRQHPGGEGQDFRRLLSDEVHEGMNGGQTQVAATNGVWTRDLRKAHQAAAALETGTVWVNCYNAFDNASPWGGMKQSGWGREKGPYGLDLFTQIKSVIVNYT